MRGGKYNGVGKIELTEFDKPVVREGTVLIKNIRAGICGTDLHAYLEEGDSVGIMPGNQFGHEMVGVIEEVGEGVEGFEAGQKVFVNPTTFREYPEGWNFTMSADMAGAFSEYILVEDPQWDYNLFKLPEDIDINYLALTEPLSVSMNGVMLAEPKKEDKAIVYGAGTIGLACLTALKYCGVEEVIVADSVPLRLEAVEKLGGIPCDITKMPTNEFAVERWGSSTGNLGQQTNLADLVFDCAGYPKAIDDYLEYAMPNSKLICIAMGNSPTEITSTEIVAKMITIIGSAGYTPEVIVKVLEMLAAGTDVSPLITDVFPLSEITTAFDEAAKGDQNIKVLIDHSK